MKSRAIWIALCAFGAACSAQTITSPVPPVAHQAVPEAAGAMPAFVQNCHASPASTTTAQTVNCGTAAVAGDVFYVFVYIHNLAPSITPPGTSWNKAFTCTNTANNSLTVYTHTVEAGEANAYNWSWNAPYYAHVNMFEVQGANAVAPIAGKACSAVSYGAVPQTVTSGAAAAQPGDLPIFQSGESNAYTAPSAGSASGASAGA